jgi:hypothetical protein
MCYIATYRNALFSNENDSYTSENDSYRSENTSYPSENALYRSENALYRSENASFLSENASFLSENALFLNENTSFIKDRRSLFNNIGQRPMKTDEKQVQGCKPCIRTWLVSYSFCSIFLFMKTRLRRLNCCRFTFHRALPNAIDLRPLVLFFTLSNS